MQVSNSTPESQLRLKYAQAIAESCPKTLFKEIALTGSSARGIATASSDIEINFWVDQLPDVASRTQWIASLGTQDIVAHDKPRPDNSYWINGTYQGIELEAGWQTIADLEAALSEIIDARSTNHKTLRLAELVLSAQALRGSGVLNKWQSILKHYPSKLSSKLIDVALTDWLNDSWYAARMAENSFKTDIHRVWRLLFALNHQWEINWKYARYSLSSLKIYPKDIMRRIWEIQNMDTRAAIMPMIDLITETLELIRINIGESDLLKRNLHAARNLL